MKKIAVQIQDDTKTTVAEPVEIRHMSDLGDKLKEVVDDFVTANNGAVIPPVTIRAVEED